MFMHVQKMGTKTPMSCSAEKLQVNCVKCKSKVHCTRGVSVFCLKSVVFYVCRIYIVHDEVKDKAFELELSWVGEGKNHQCSASCPLVCLSLLLV